MMRMRTKSPAAAVAFASVKASVPAKDSPATIPVNEQADWEVRPCGMLVQKRSDGGGCGAAAAPPVPAFRLRVKHGTNLHEIYISSQATFGELKKLLAEKTGLHPQDQKILFKDKERDSAAYLDISGVKDRSKLVVVEDPTAQAKRFLEMRRAARTEKAAKSISQIGLEVDKLASQVSALEAVISRGGKVADGEVVKLTELLMNELLKLDSVNADGDVKLRRRMQVKRVQKYVETLDLLKVKNATPKADREQVPPAPAQTPLKNQSPASPRRRSAVVTTKWETFDSLFSPAASTSASATTTGTSTAASSATPTPRFDWELF
ncbi:BAG family molecular chaperone regulator 3 [Apostasia shenzhenica]|uniref:BAG family molecular chaperone regulator 3 n=1 Tax=Apostasia shenzhenica TaxID=1088818 RepID=A0A2H9ZTE2_9ASPA|nr:BAG family molecular chaperone regulator 3 [Apostasia shenzhenica]